MNKVFLEDCIHGMKNNIKTESVDLIITDPPFGINFNGKPSNYNRTSSNVIEGYNEVSRCSYYNFTFFWLAQAYRTLKDSGSIFVFSSYNNLEFLLRALRIIGFKEINHIIWKYNFGVYTTKKFVASHYHILYYCKNPKKRKFYRRYDDSKKSYQDMEDVWNIKKEYWRNQPKTPTKLPREIVEKILFYASKKKDLVMDPFLGSGQVAKVAKLNKRRYVGFEIVPKYFSFISDRLLNNNYP